MAKNSIGEIVKEFVLRVDGLEFSVKGRIVKTVNPKGEDEFEWHISHHCKPSQGAGVYFPSVTSGNKQEDVEQFLIGYMQVFTTLGVTPNKYY